MQTESRTNKKTLKDFNIQGSNLDLKYLGPYANINTTEVLCSLATLPQLLLVETGKTESKLPQLSSPRFPFSPPSLLYTLYFVLFSWSFDCKISNLQILSQREIRRTCKQIFPFCPHRTVFPPSIQPLLSTHQLFRASRIASNTTWSTGKASFHSISSMSSPSLRDF